ncbi:DNA topoisomerase 3-alpha [Biomphalaria glabrata]|uniref:DNA topoisomerase n=1 Tax=Biomphalaria glabrata TaxID=6526 RepID=A0A2C9JFT2_BIOGL|nr:DNA topoisomerase 3-alpha [Biomphalaria glabrata]
MIFKLQNIKRFSNLAKFDIPGKMRVLNVAEKNDAAKSLAHLLSQGHCRKREGFSRFNKIYEFEYRFLNQNVTMTMTSVSGHLLGLEFIGNFRKWGACNPVDLFSVPVEKYCPQNYTDIKRTLENEIKGCQYLVIWTDCDREGENIGFEVIQVCQAVKPNIKVYRAKFSEITQKAITRAMNNLVEPDARINDAVDVRQELDLRIGAAFTRFQTLRLQKIFPQALAEQLVSYGSCQFPTLGFVVERYKQVQSFIPEPFWKLKVMHQHDDVTAEFSWKRNRLFDLSACQVLYDMCIENPVATVAEVNSKNKSKWRPPALDTVELEKLSSRKLKINAKETMTIAEKLYTQGLISYPRTETNIFPKDLDLVSLVQEQTGDSNWGEFAQRVLEHGPNPRNGTKTDQAHPPIHPLKYSNNLQGNDRKVYEFIVRHFLACVSQDAQGHETVVEINIAGESFTAQGLMILARNYLDVYPYEKWNAKEIPIYYQGDQFEPNSIELVHGETTAPPLLTEADLIALMEKHGIGTDATHADHIETVKSRMYVGLRADGRFVPGQLGMGLVEGYDNMGYEMSKPHLRAELEADLKLICEGKKTKEEVLRVQIQKYKEVFIEACRQAQKLDEALSQYLGEAQPVATSEAVTDATTSIVMKCPKCGRPMYLRSKKDGKGYYIGCSAYPDCRACIWLPDFILQVSTTDQICERCQPGPVTKLQFKFKPGSVPLSIPNDYIGCIGGCNEMLNETLGIRSTPSSSSQSQPALFPRTDITIHTPRTTGQQNNTLTQRNSGVGGERIQSINTGATSQSRSFHTSNPASSVRPLLKQSELSFLGTNKKTVTSISAGSAPSNAFRAPQASIRPLRTPLTVMDNSFNAARMPPIPKLMSSTNFSTFSDASDKAIVCSCGNDAVILTVRKEGPNTGRQFYKCAGVNGSNCNFFLWADDSSEQPQSQSTRLPLSSGNHFTSLAVPNRNQGSSGGSNRNSEDNEVLCKCGIPAKFLTVQKQGPNTGRQFYGCSKPREQSCGFFQWADDSATSSGSQFPAPNFGKSPSFQTSGQLNKRKRSSADSDGVPKQRKPPTCGYCGQPGHKKPKCPERTEEF